MRTPRRTVLALTALSFISVLARAAAACTCVEYGTPPCAAYWRAQAVFVGTGTNIKEPEQAATGTLPQALVSFSVEQSFKGVSGTEAQVATLWGTSCDYRFEVGRRHLVYAHKSPNGTLENWPCDRTTSFAHAGEDLDYIRSLSNSTPAQSSIGRVAEQKYEPLQGVTISVEGAGKTYHAVTDGEGRYKVEVAKPGSYRVRASVPFSVGLISYKEGSRRSRRRSAPSPSTQRSSLRASAITGSLTSKGST